MNINLTIKQRVRLMCEKSDITMLELANRLGVAISPFSQRLKTGKFTKEELQNIAQVAGCEYVSYFVFNNGAKFSAENNKQQIRGALDYIDMSASELGRKMGLTQQAISKRMMIGKFTQEDMRIIAEYMGCDYVSEFRFNDGTAI